MLSESLESVDSKSLFVFQFHKFGKCGIIFGYFILQIYFWNMKHRYLTQNKLGWRSKECLVQIWSCIDIPTLSLEKPYTYSCRCQLVLTVTIEFDHYQTTESSWHEISLGTCNVKFCKTTCWTRIFQLRSQYLPSNDHISQALIPLMDALRIINLIILGRVKFSKHVLGIEPKGLVVHTTFEQSNLYKSCLFGPIVLSNLCKIFKS